MLAQDKIFLSGIATFKDVISAGYMFIEAILSVLPIVDEMLISDGGSTDGTLESLERLQKMFPNKIKLFRDRWVKSKYWETLDNSLNLLISRARGKWLYEVQGDELVHEESLSSLLQMIKDAEEYNSIRQEIRCIFGWNYISPHIYRAVRIVRNLPKLGSKEGGDFFYIETYGKSTKGFTSHNVPPEKETVLLIYHFPSAFPQNAVEKSKRHAAFLACDSILRKKKLREAESQEKRLMDEEPSNDSLEGLPVLIEELVGLKKYEVRDCLFDKAWLNKATKLNYEGGNDEAN